MSLKRFFLSSVAVFTVANGGHAADLPAAEPVEYVHVCDAVGIGFFFLPGTDTCLKIDGYVRAEMHWVDGNSNSEESEAFNNFTTRARGRARFDARTMTDLGLLRSFIEFRGTIGPTNSGGYSDGFNVTNAWLSLANDGGALTVGHVSSFYDFWSGNATDTRIGLDDPTTEVNALAYTFAIGNGVSASVSVEDKWFRRSGLAVGLATTGGSAATTSIPTLASAVTDVAELDNEGQEIPDFVANIRVDQDWGLAQIMGTVGRVGGTGFTAGTGATVPDDDKMGWAVGGGVLAKELGPLKVVVEGDYAEGLVRYITTANGASLFDAVYSASGHIDLTKAWTVRTGAEIGVSSNVALAVDFGYANIDHGGLLAKEDYDTWAVAGTFSWKPTLGLTVKSSIAYEEIDADNNAVIISDEKSWGIEGRLQRDF